MFLMDFKYVVIESHFKFSLRKNKARVKFNSAKIVCVIFDYLT